MEANKGTPCQPLIWSARRRSLGALKTAFAQVQATMNAVFLCAG